MRQEYLQSYCTRHAGIQVELFNGSTTRTYLWNGSQLRADIGPEYSFYFNYNALGEMIGFTYRLQVDPDAGAPREYEHILVKNQQGDVEKIIRSWDQTIVASYAYDAWGNTLTATGTLAERNPIRYRGYYYDTETGFYYLQSRYYDPQTGRFINADGLITTSQGLMSYNMFAYCLDNPVNGMDYSGTKMVYIDVGGGIVRYDIIIYYKNNNSKSNFEECAQSQKYSNHTKYIPVASSKEFVSALNSVSQTTDNIYIYVHGSFDGLEFYHETLKGDEIESRINKVNASGEIFLFACHGASIANSLACSSGKPVYASVLGVSFEDGRARNSWKWVILSSFFGDELTGWYVFYPEGRSRKSTDPYYV